MAGVGEALAIVSCVAGLIQAYDAGNRIVRQIKARRQAHGALPPSELLEQSLEKGKREIQEVVSEGNKRFGSDFEAGDATAQLAILQITVSTQNALLERLTMARDDDGVIDFDECVDFSDKGRNDALLALRLLFQRKLEEEMSRKRTAALHMVDIQKETTHIQPVGPAEEVQPEAKSTISLQTFTASPSKAEHKKSTSFSRIFRRGTFDQASLDRQLSKSSLPDLEPVKSPPLSLAKRDRSSTGNIDLYTPLRPRVVPRQSIRSLGSNFESSWRTQTSRSSTFSTTSQIDPITKYGGCCKYAHKIRETGPSDGLVRQGIGFHVHEIFFACKSIKCRFRISAAETKNGFQIDDAVYDYPGLKYRLIFLAKSHVAHEQVSNQPPFLCLICIMSKTNSETYRGSDQLFQHILGHQNGSLGETFLEGPLVFNNNGVVDDPKFDINLLKIEDPPLTPRSDYSIPVEIEKELENEPYKFDRQSKGSSVFSDSTEVTSSPIEPFENPWAALA